MISRCCGLKADLLNWRLRVKSRSGKIKELERSRAGILLVWFVDAAESQLLEFTLMHLIYLFATENTTCHDLVYQIDKRVLCIMEVCGFYRARCKSILGLQEGRCRAILQTTLRIVRLFDSLDLEASLRTYA